MATEEEIIKFCKKHLAGYKRPKYVEFRKELPTSAVGKVLRRVLKDEELKKTKDVKLGVQTIDKNGFILTIPTTKINNQLTFS